MDRARGNYFEQNMEQVRQETLNTLKIFKAKKISPKNLLGKIELLLNNYIASSYIKGLERRKEDKAYLHKAREFAYDLQVSYS